MIYRYENAFGTSITFGGDSAYKLTSVSGTSGNTATVTDSFTPDEIGATVTGYKVESKQVQFTGDYPSSAENTSALLDAVITGSGKLYAVDGSSVRYLDVYVTQTPDIERENALYNVFDIEFHAGFPYWRDFYPVQVPFTEEIPLFRYPLYVSDRTPFKVATKEKRYIRDVQNRSPVSCGFIAVFTTDEFARNPILTHTETQKKIELLDVDLYPNERIEISTVAGRKYARLYHEDGNYENLFSKMTDDSEFFVLDPGSNNLHYTAAEGEKDLELTIQFERIYLGVA